MSLAHVADHIDHLDIAAALRSGANVAALVRDLARANGISFTAGPLDVFAGAVSRLSGAEVRPDETENLLVALARAGIITSAASMALQAGHLRRTAG